MRVESLSKIFISKEVASDLALRDNAIQFFDKVNKDESKNVTIDFSNVNTITLSFADEYLKRKKRSKKEITEENVPLNILKMFEIVQKESQPPTPKPVS